MSPAPRHPYRSARGNDPETAGLRTIFLRAAHEVRPRISEELVERAFPPFCRLADTLEDGGEDELWVVSWRGSSSDHQNTGFIGPLSEVAEEIRAADLRDERAAEVRKEELRAELLEALLAWARPYNLHRDEWVMDYAIASLQEFGRVSDEDSGAEPPRLGWSIPFLSFTPPPRTPRLRTFRPDQETKREFLRRAGTYAEEVGEAAKAAGWEPGSSRPSVGAHLLWLARFQVAEETVSQITRRARASQRTVEQAIKQAAELIGLTRRTL